MGALEKMMKSKWRQGQSLPPLPKREQCILAGVCPFYVQNHKGPRSQARPGLWNGSTEGRKHLQWVAHSEGHFLSAAPLGTGGDHSLIQILPIPALSPSSLALCGWRGLTGTCTSFILLLYWFYRNCKVINTHCKNIQITKSIDIGNGRSENTTLLLPHHPPPPASVAFPKSHTLGTVAISRHFLRMWRQRFLYQK